MREVAKMKQNRIVFQQKIASVNVKIINNSHINKFLSL